MTGWVKSLVVLVIDFVVDILGADFSRVVSRLLFVYGSYLLRYMYF